MQEDWVIWHNPRCSKSRETLKLLEGAGIRPRIVEYLKTPPEDSEIKRVLGFLGSAPLDLVRKKEPPFKALGLADSSVTDDAIIQAMTENPVLIERPVVIHGDRAVVGRPPEAVLELINR
jgi:arsenate reductase